MSLHDGLTGLRNNHFTDSYILPWFPTSYQASLRFCLWAKHTSERPQSRNADSRFRRNGYKPGVTRHILHPTLSLLYLGAYWVVSRWFWLCELSMTTAITPAQNPERHPASHMHDHNFHSNGSNCMKLVANCSESAPHPSANCQVPRSKSRSPQAHPNIQVCMHHVLSPKWPCPNYPNYLMQAATQSKSLSSKTWWFQHHESVQLNLNVTVRTA